MFAMPGGDLETEEVMEEVVFEVCDDLFTNMIAVWGV